MVTMLPRLVQALLSALGDCWTVELSRRLFGQESSCWTAFSLLCSWFLHYTASRTLTNVAEQVATAGALALYPWRGQKQPSTSWGYLWPVGLAVMIRPTALALWLPLVLLHFAKESHSRTYLFKRLLFTSATCLATLLLCDRWFYGRWVCTPWNFVRLNLVADIGVPLWQPPVALVL
uniref:Mannosyltransferase n=1 Tax=Ixodes scapularis TaxID=6945 RepID=A0A4D5RVW6_IXOSC